MSYVEITIKATPIGGGRRHTIAVLTEKDTTLDPARIGEVLGRYVRQGVERALGFPTIPRERGIKITYTYRGQELTEDRATFMGFYTVREAIPDRLGTQLVDYMRLRVERSEHVGTEINVKLNSIIALEARHF